MSGSIAYYTVGQLIAQTLKIAGVLGVGQTASAEDSNDCLQQLNQILAQWQRKRWLVYGEVTTSLVATGALTYSVGPTGDFPIARPGRLESAFMRFLNQSGTVTVDIPLQLIQSREDYNLITVKNLNTVPLGVYYDNNVPLGTLYFWPVPKAGAYELFISTTSTLQSFTSLTQIITMPPEYLAAMQWTLAVTLRPMYGLAPDPTIAALALDAQNALRNSNAQIATLTMPGNLPGQGQGYYSPYSDWAG